MNTPESQELDIQNIFRGYIRPLANFITSRKLRVGIFNKSPIYIHTYPRLIRNNPFLPSADQISHSLSILDTNKAERLSQVVRHFVLRPELIFHRTMIVSHFFLPQEALLVACLYPRRFDIFPFQGKNSNFQPTKKQDSGLLATVISSLCEFSENTNILDRFSGHQTSPTVHKFTIIRANLQLSEIKVMKEISEINTPFLEKSRFPYIV